MNEALEKIHLKMISYGKSNPMKSVAMTKHAIAMELALYTKQA